MTGGLKRQIRTTRLATDAARCWNYLAIVFSHLAAISQMHIFQNRLLRGLVRNILAFVLERIHSQNTFSIVGGRRDATQQHSVEE